MFPTCLHGLRPPKVAEQPGPPRETGERLSLFYITSLTQTIRPLASPLATSKSREQLATAIQKTLQKYDWYGPSPKT